LEVHTSGGLCRKEKYLFSMNFFHKTCGYFMEFSYLCKRNEVDGFGKLFKIQKLKSYPK